ncbi:MAG: hypothetical protein RLZZ67_49 [Candidatus Parcubacteria bacterium]|jgi:hypothetical protein
MSKKSFIFLILIILIIFGLIGWYLYTTKTGPQGTTPGTTNNDDLFPFGPGGTNNQNNGTSTSGGGDGFVDLSVNGEVRLPRLRQISFVPTAGATASSTASSTIIRYMERATGHIYETDSENPKVTKISTITIPKVHEALFTADSTKLLVRYLNDSTGAVRTFYAKIATTTRPEQAIEGLFLTDDIKDVTVFGNKIFYLLWSDTNEQGIVSDMDGSYKTVVFNSSFGEWTANWTSQNIINLSSKPSSAARGASYILNPGTGNYTKMVGDLNGLETVANNDGSLILVSNSTTNYYSASILETKTGKTQRLGLSTLAGKCVWSKKDITTIYCAVPKEANRGSYPDDWYKGKMSFDDSLWKINAVSGETTEILTPELSTGTSMDIMKLSLDQKENVILFTNKKDMTTWRYNLVE